ncbi:Rieske (2Fe-2S) protein [Dermatophilaceae bacterium Soc4.6]
MTQPQVDRRTLVRSACALGVGTAAVVGLGGCGSSGPAPASGAPAGGAATGTTVPVADIPVGGGKIVGDVVVTQPTKDSFKAFSVVCTHQGCPVSKIEGGQIECTCHGSMFDIATGAPSQGPARQPLAPRTATVKGTDVVVS